MSAFLGVLVVTLIVSGDGATMSEDSVLLPCACAERNLHEEFKWQMESPNKILVLKYNNTTPNVNPSYMGRAKIFLPEHHDNCSVLFTNITVDDQGEYKCIFHKQEEYQSSLVYLNVSGCYTVCHSADNLGGSINVFKCHVKKRYRETEIQWILDGQLLTESNNTNITHTYTLDVPTGLYHFNSTRSTEGKWSVVPECHVKDKGTSTNSSHASRTTNEVNEANPDRARYRYLTIIPIMLVLGLSLLLWRRWDAQSSQRTREVGADNFYC